MSHFVLVHYWPISVDVIQSLNLIVSWNVIQNCRCAAFPGRILVYYLEVRFNARDAMSLHVSIK
jgi:hypothetical protein